MLTVGFDVHLRWWALCILSSTGEVIKQMRVQAHWREAIRVLQELKQPFAICYEASCGYGPLHDALSSVAERVIVAHPGGLRLIFRSKRKNDRVDARKLATLLLLEQVPAVHVPDAQVRNWRGLIEFRQRLISDRTRIKNRLRAMIRGQDLPVRSGKGAWTRVGRAELAALELSEVVAVQRDLLLDELKSLEEKIRRVTRVLDQIGRKHPGVRLLRTIPGVGPRTSEAVVAYIDAPNRFRNKQVGCYFGLVPCQDASADKNRLGHITREGPASARKLLAEATWQGIRHSPRIRAFFERVQGGDPQRKKIAVVATAHFLVRAMHAMLRTGEAWRELAEAKVA